MFIHVPANLHVCPKLSPSPTTSPLRTIQSSQSNWLYHPQLDNPVHRITHQQDNPVHRITQSPNRPHIDNPISTSPSESSKITTPKCMCAVSTSRYRFQFTVSIPTWCPHTTSGHPISENTHTKNINFD